jgi:F0F1-type ATP synthase epsilon subunit
MPTPATQTILLTIRTREAVYYQAEVLSVSSFNGKGPFDILPRHAHFISIIEKLLSVREKTSQVKRFEITLGVMQVEDNTIKIYLDEEPRMLG